MAERLNPDNKLMADGCHLNSDIGSAIGRAGFDRIELESLDVNAGNPLTGTGIVAVAWV